MEISTHTIVAARLAGLKAEAAVLEAALNGAPATNVTESTGKATKAKKEKAAEVADTSSVDLLSFGEEAVVEDEKPADKKTILKAAQDFATKKVCQPSQLCFRNTKQLSCKK